METLANINENENTNDMFCSFKAETSAEKAKLFKAMNNPDKKLSDCINTEILVKDVFCEVIEIQDTSTGEMKPMPRIVLIDDKDVSYHCISTGIYTAIKKLIKVYGTPTWETPIHIMIKQVKSKNRNILTFDVVD